MRIGLLALLIMVLLRVDIQASNPAQVIHVIGDSHSTEFMLIPGCIIHHIGPVTMHRIGRDGMAGFNIKNLGVKDSDAVVFAFGEIDVRCHVGKQRDRHRRNLDEIINSLASNYICTILQNSLEFKNLTCIVYSVTPPTDQGYNPTYPYYGTLEDRVFFTKKLNTRLAQLCDQFSLAFLDVYNDYADAEGKLISHMSDGSVHLNPTLNQPIQQKLHEILKKRAGKQRAA